MTVDYFAELWRDMDGNRRSYKKGDKAAWDERAEQFNQDGPDERLELVTSLLLDQHMLTSDSTVLDIGCGPGRFALEFARTARSVIGLDISPRMLQAAADNAAARGAGNVDFRELDWHQAQLDELGWRRKFSLVTAIMSPALDSRESLDKILAASSGCGLLCHFVEQHDSILGVIKKTILQRPTVDEYGNIGLYCSFNILWHYRMYPEVAYFDTQRERVRTLEEANRYYLGRLEAGEDMTPAQETAIRGFLHSQAENGLITDRITSKIACVYWRR